MWASPWIDEGCGLGNSRASQDLGRLHEDTSLVEEVESKDSELVETRSGGGVDVGAIRTSSRFSRLRLALRTRYKRLFVQLCIPMG